MGWLGWVEFHLGEEDEGLDSLRLAWSLKQEDLELALLLARLEFAKGEAELAIKRAHGTKGSQPGEVKTLLKRWESETLS